MLREDKKAELEKILREAKDDVLYLKRVWHPWKENWLAYRDLVIADPSFLDLLGWENVGNWEQGRLLRIKRVKVDGPFFRFFHEGQRKSYFFTLSCDRGLPDVEDFFYEEIQPLIEKRQLETKYGVHDFDTRGDNMLWGFTSYEVATRKMGKLMAEWQEIFQSLGFKTGELQVVKGNVE